ncbi:metallo-beta-lactamase domain protein [Dictyocaulus viviparus]|uniref:Metallo-beta-lactamase domain-containing protein 1 n=1 Tax=Dictyocaulus viviparus TaxID=29172 RepID=A0A0D8XFU5_DICVI|nr:metallo-beta-lactamase domain protein [Dictyocaulus viviparus]
MMLLILLAFSATSFAKYGRFLLTKDIVRSLDDWERALLRDFVRGKGHGSVSRIPVELLNEPPPDFDTTQDNSFIALVNPPETAIRSGPKLMIPQEALRITSISITPNNKSDTRKLKEDRRVSSVITPASKVRRRLMSMTNATLQRGRPVSEEATQQTYKELSTLLQAFIDRRKPLLRKTVITLASTPSTPRIRNQDEKGETTLDTFTTEHWKIMDPNDQPENEEGFGHIDIDDSNEDWEEKMRELSGQLSNILTMIKNAKQSRSVKDVMIPEKQKPILTILRNGSANQTSDGRYNFIASITLIQDNNKNILVDTGLGTDINGRTDLLNALKKQNLAPPNIDIVVTTHGHPDHAGGIHDFPDAVHYQGWYIHEHTTFNLSTLFEGNQHALTENVYLIKSAGHSSDDIAVVISDEQTMGVVIIAGDTFMRREDLDYPMMWKPLSANEVEQGKSRKSMICQANWIVPGHGEPFSVTQEMRTQFYC